MKLEARPYLWPTLLAAALGGQPAAGQSRSGLELDWQSVDGPVNVSAGGDLELSATVGQPDAETLTGGDLTLDGGFWAVGSVPATGDFDIDGDIDLFDFAAFFVCFTGSGGGPFAPGCEVGDFQDDGDIDLPDYALLILTCCPRPPAPTITTLAHKTNDATPVINGMAAANANVNVFIDDQLDGTTTADGSGNWSFEHARPALADGDYTFTANSTNSFGDSPFSNSLVLTIDTIVAPPTMLAATASIGQVLLTWCNSADSDVIGYEVWRKPAPPTVPPDELDVEGYGKVHPDLVAPGITPMDICTPSPSCTCIQTEYCDDNGLSLGAAYLYRVSAVDDALQESP